MFKTKPVFKLPDAPKPPTQEMMQEDLMIAANDDDLFLLLSSNEEDGRGSFEDDDIENVSAISLPPTDREIFGLATKLFQSCKELEEDANSLKEKCVYIKRLSNSLGESVDDVKKQALTAMSTS